VTGEGYSPATMSSGSATRLMHPLQAQRLAEFTAIMTQATTTMLQRWQILLLSRAPGWASEMMRFDVHDCRQGALRSRCHAGSRCRRTAAATVLEHTYQRLKRSSRSRELAHAGQPAFSPGLTDPTRSSIASSRAAAERPQAHGSLSLLLHERIRRPGGHERSTTA